jgi:hypothetical protein
LGNIVFTQLMALKCSLSNASSSASPAAAMAAGRRAARLH